jgi:hypothetical protein
VSLIGLVFIVSLGLVYMYAGRLPWRDSSVERHWLSFGAGVSIAYVFVDILPLLANSQASVAYLDSGPLSVLTHNVYLVALVGLAAFYSLELFARRSRFDRPATGLEEGASFGVFWLHAGSFALYNALLGYLLREAEDHGFLACLLLFATLALHFMVISNSLRSHHRLLYDRYGRWILGLAVIGGYLVGTRYMVGAATIALLWAFVAGGLILNVFKDELPEHHNASLAAFLGGMVGYSALLVSVAH